MVQNQKKFHLRIIAVLIMDYLTCLELRGEGVRLFLHSDEFKKFKIEIKTDSHITECVDINNKKEVGKFILNNGEEISSDRCIFTIHPDEILKIIPRDYLTKAFIDRINSFEPSAGFFSLYCVLNDDLDEADFETSIISLLPKTDLDSLFEPSYKGRQALVIMNSFEKFKKKLYKVINCCELSFHEHVSLWKETKYGQRPQSYYDYKKQHMDNIQSSVERIFPKFKNSLQAYIF